MITPAQAAAYATQESSEPSSPVRQFEFKIDDAIRKAELDDRFPVTISLVGASNGIRRMFECEYAKAGWAVKIVSDQRDGDYLEINRRETP